MRIIGIDAGTTSIKAVEIDSAFGRYELHEYHEQPIEPGSDPKLGIETLLGGLPKRPDRVVVSMRTAQTTFRNLHLPARDRKAIQAGVRFELEDELPFDIEKAVYDYSILSQGRQGTDLHVAATLKSNLLTQVNLWLNSGVDPDLLTTEAWALNALMNRALTQTEQDRPVLLALTGHERTILYIHWRGATVLAREISWGGIDLTTAICQKYHIPLEQAEQAKRDHGFVLSSEMTRGDVTREQVDFSGTLRAPIDTLILEMRQAILTCKSSTHENVHSIYLCGGTSLLPGIARVIEEGLQVPVHPLKPLTSASSSGVSYSEQADAGFALATGLALTFVGSGKTTAINFRKGEFSKQGRSREFNWAMLKKPLYATGAVVTCMILSLAVQSSVYNSRLVDVNAQLERSVRSFFGQIAPSAVRGYVNNPANLKTAINKELNKQREIARLVGPNPRSPLNYLKNISQALPKDAAVDMISYQAGAAPSSSYTKPGDSTTSLTFLVHKQEDVERIRSLLAGRIKELQASAPTEVISDGAAKKWKVTFTGKLTEDSYGR
jgi:type IV pilus assembly protein PilM